MFCSAIFSALAWFLIKLRAKNCFFTLYSLVTIIIGTNNFESKEFWHLKEGKHSELDKNYKAAYKFCRNS